MHSFLTLDYAQNVKQFSEAARAARAIHHHYDLNAFPDQKLTTQVALLGDPAARNVVVISSGAHGVELPLGSMLQRDWMHAAKELCRDNETVRFVFVHALNPYGAAHGLRSDHENIDVCRNFGDFSPNKNINPFYASLASAFLPAGIDTLHLAASWAKMVGHSAWHLGHPSVRRTLTYGQNQFADGLYYTGQAASWSRQTWANIIKHHVLTFNTRDIWHIDIHTGEGRYGKMQVLAGETTNRIAQLRALHLSPDNHLHSAAKEFGPTAGDLTDYWQRLMQAQVIAPHVVVTPITLEFGTYNGPYILQTMMKRNALRHIHHDNHAAGDQIIADMRDAFAPPQRKWETTTRRQGAEFWKRLVEKVARPA